MEDSWEDRKMRNVLRSLAVAGLIGLLIVIISLIGKFLSV